MDKTLLNFETYSLCRSVCHYSLWFCWFVFSCSFSMHQSRIPDPPVSFSPPKAATDFCAGSSYWRWRFHSQIQRMKGITLLAHTFSHDRRGKSLVRHSVVQSFLNVFVFHPNRAKGAKSGAYYWWQLWWDFSYARAHIASFRIGSP